MSVPQAQPASGHDRLLVIDATRGLALLGILFVNIDSFAMPFGTFLNPLPPTGESGLSLLLFYFVNIFCEGKFYPLFSMLFGIGLVLQMQSIESRGGPFYGLYLRRLLVLMLIGLGHALLLWYGDILFIYAFAGLVLMAAAKLKGRALLFTGIGILAFTTLLGGAASGLSAFGSAQRSAYTSTNSTFVTSDAQQSSTGTGTADDSASASSPSSSNTSASPTRRLFQAFQNNQMNGGPESPFWMELETQAYRDGPFLEAFIFRAMTWAMFVVFCVFGFGWHVIAMFFLGAGVMKLGLLASERRAWRIRLIVLGLVVGLPGSVAATLLPQWSMGVGVMAAQGMLLFACGPLMSLMYLCVITEIVHGAKGVVNAGVNVLASVGRMALTNYLTHTLACTAIFYWWGLAQFGEWSRTERTALVPAIFAVQCIISPLWLKAFRFGPMEWLWRTLTYWKRQPMMR